MQVTILHNQSLLDIAIQHTGSVENAFAIAVENGLSVSSELVPGAKLQIPNTVVVDRDIANYFATKGLQPATGITDLSIVPTGRGIGWMRIEQDFIVS